MLIDLVIQNSPSINQFNLKKVKDIVKDNSENKLSSSRSPSPAGSNLKDGAECSCLLEQLSESMNNERDNTKTLEMLDLILERFN